MDYHDFLSLAVKLKYVLHKLLQTMCILFYFTNGIWCVVCIGKPMKSSQIIFKIVHTFLLKNKTFYNLTLVDDVKRYFVVICISFLMAVCTKLLLSITYFLSCRLEMPIFYHVGPINDVSEMITCSRRMEHNSIAVFVRLLQIYRKSIVLIFKIFHSQLHNLL